MKRLLPLLFVTSLSLFGNENLQQTITFSVSARSSFSVSVKNEMTQIFGPAPLFNLDGEDHSESITNYYAITTNEQNRKIMAYLDQNMPNGTSLVVYLTPPEGARSLGVIPLSATPIDLVIEISKVSQTGLPLTYTFSASEEAGDVPTTTRIITYMIVDG